MRKIPRVGISPIVGAERRDAVQDALGVRQIDAQVLISAQRQKTPIELPDRRARRGVVAAVDAAVGFDVGDERGARDIIE